MTRGTSAQLQCSCPAYAFPHRWRSGDCTGWLAVQEIWESSDACVRCTYRDSVGECFLLKAKEVHQPEHCPGLGEVVK